MRDVEKLDSWQEDGKGDTVPAPRVRASPSLGEAHDWLSYLPQIISFVPPSGHPSSHCPASRASSSESPILLRIPPSTHAPLFAHRQWRSGLIMSDILHSRMLPLAGARVLELGAGTALPSILCARDQDVQRIVVTDYDEASLLQRMRENVEANTFSDKRLRVRGHTWGVNVDDLRDEMGKPSISNTQAENDTADVILLADCLWDKFSHAPLLRTLTHLLSKDRNSRIYIVSGLHTGREVLFSFMQASYRLGFRVLPMPSSEQWPAVAEESEEDSPLADAQVQLDAAAHVLELGLAFGDENGASSSPAREAAMTADTSRQQAREAQTIRVHEERLNGKRRSFLWRERAQERKEAGGVKERNQWVCVWAMGWQ